MNKLARISFVLAGTVMVPAFFAGACGGDDSTGSGGTSGTGGSAGSATGGTAGSGTGGTGGATGGTGGATGGSGGSTGGAAGSATGGTGGSAGSSTGGSAGKGTGGSAGSATGGTAGSSGSGGKAGGDGSAGTAGTGGSAGSAPEAGRDSSGDATDASVGDGGLNTCTRTGNAMGLTCDNYCSTYIAVCKPIATYMNTFMDKADCMNKCASYSQDVLCCRAEHVNLARDTKEAGADATTHCGHASGLSTCQ